MGYIPEKFAIPKDHLWQYSISFRDIAAWINLDCVILTCPANIGKLPDLQGHDKRTLRHSDGRCGR